MGGPWVARPGGAGETPLSVANEIGSLGRATATDAPGGGGTSLTIVSIAAGATLPQQHEPPTMAKPGLLPAQCA